MTKVSGKAYGNGVGDCPTESNGWHAWVQDPDGKPGHKKWIKVNFAFTCGSPWSEWNICSASCGGGNQFRERYSANGDTERESRDCK